MSSRAREGDRQGGLGGLLPPAPVLGIVWGLSCLALLPAFADPDLSRTALVLVPWVLFAGWPATRPQGVVERSVPALALALPVLSLAVALDRSSGLPLRGVLAVAGYGLALASLLAGARAGASRSPEALRALHAGGWLVGCLLLPLLALVTRPGEISAGWRAIAIEASPVAWAIARVPAASQPSAGAPWIGAAYALALWFPVAWFARPRAGRSQRKVERV